VESQRTPIEVYELNMVILRMSATPCCNLCAWRRLMIVSRNKVQLSHIQASSGGVIAVLRTNAATCICYAVTDSYTDIAKS
jgi:hypothetical protein